MTPGKERKRDFYDSIYIAQRKILVSFLDFRTSRQQKFLFCSVVPSSKLLSRRAMIGC